MSAYSELWASMDPNVRQFYHNFADLHAGFTGRTMEVIWPWVTGYYTRDMFTFQGWEGFHIAQRNFTEQLYFETQLNPDRVLMYEYDIWGRLEFQPFARAMLITGWADQFTDIPDLADQWPRAKYNVRKSYWTGAPRRRRNL